MQHIILVVNSNVTAFFLYDIPYRSVEDYIFFHQSRKQETERGEHGGNQMYQLALTVKGCALCSCSPFTCFVHFSESTRIILLNNINFLVFVVVTRGEIVLCEVGSQFEYIIEINFGLRVFKVIRVYLFVLLTLTYTQIYSQQLYVRLTLTVSQLLYENFGLAVM